MQTINPLYSLRDTCRLCGSDHLANILPLPATPAGDHYVPQEKLCEAQPTFPLDVLLCTDCGQSQLAAVVLPGFLYGSYTYRTSVSLGLAQHFQDYADDLVARLSLPEGSLVVDIGSNDGTFLNGFTRHGLRLLGVDPASTVAQEAIARGIPTINRFFSPETAREIMASHGSARLITANNVFANIDDLESFVAGVALLLDERGAFVFETGYWLDLVNNRVIDNIYHEHLSYFSVAPLARFFARHGLVLTDVVHSSSKGGSIRGIVRRMESGATPSGKVEAMLSAERAFGLHDPASYKPLESLLSDLQNKFGHLVAECQLHEKTLAGFGASVGVTTLLYALGLNDNISFLVDDNPLKQGLFSPGGHIPVLAPQALYDKTPDYVILFPWRYRDTIMAKHAAYTKHGGKFVFPLPTYGML